MKTNAEVETCRYSTVPQSKPSRRSITEVLSEFSAYLILVFGALVTAVGCLRTCFDPCVESFVTIGSGMILHAVGLGLLAVLSIADSAKKITKRLAQSTDTLI